MVADNNHNSLSRPWRRRTTKKQVPWPHVIVTWLENKESPRLDSLVIELTSSYKEVVYRIEENKAWVKTWLVHGVLVDYAAIDVSDGIVRV